jgi:hypothetical protein
MNADVTRGNSVHHGLEVLKVQNIMKAIADRFDDDRKIVVRSGDLKQVAGTQTLQPKRRTFSDMCLRQQECSFGVLAKQRSEEGRANEFLEHQFLGSRRAQVGEEIEGEPLDIRTPEKDPVIVVEHLNFDGKALIQLPRQRESDQAVHPSSEA